MEYPAGPRQTPLVKIKQATCIFEKELVGHILCDREFLTIGYGLTKGSQRERGRKIKIDLAVRHPVLARKLRFRAQRNKCPAI